MHYAPFPYVTSDPTIDKLRGEVRDFLDCVLADQSLIGRAESWTGWDPEFSRATGSRGWIGMTWPEAYGGQRRSALERYVVVEEMLAAGAPVAAHWIADRQSGPLLLRYGSDAQKRTLLPRIAQGTCFFCVGMSEPDTGSDLASVRTRAKPVNGGWVVNGTKLWVTGAHRCHYLILFCRTSGSPQDRHKGTSQLLVDLKSTGITIRPIRDMSGKEHFNEVTFEDVFVPAESLIGCEGEGWNQVMSELALERSGPERFLSSFALLTELIRAMRRSSGDAARLALGRLVSHLMVLRHLSQGVAALIESGKDPVTHAAIVKDLGALFEQEIPEVAQSLIQEEPGVDSSCAFSAVLAHTLLCAPSFSLRGGTREILRGIIARGLGMR